MCTKLGTRIIYPRIEGGFLDSTTDLRGIFDSATGAYGKVPFQFVSSDRMTPDMIDRKLKQVLVAEGLDYVDVSDIPRQPYSFTNPEEIGTLHHTLINNIAPSFCAKYKSLEQLKILVPDHGIQNTIFNVDDNGEVSVTNLEKNKNKILNVTNGVTKTLVQNHNYPRPTKDRPGL